MHSSLQVRLPDLKRSSAQYSGPLIFGHVRSGHSFVIGDPLLKHAFDRVQRPRRLLLLSYIAAGYNVVAVLVVAVGVLLLSTLFAVLEIVFEELLLIDDVVVGIPFAPSVRASRSGPA